jgi:carboxypeptidase T
MAFALMTTQAWGHGGKIKADRPTYWMKFKAADKYQRSEVANLGVAVEAIVEDHVMAIGGDEELKAAKKSGRLIQHFKLTTRMLDFPSYDSNFHNYNELMAAIRNMASENPELVRLGTLGKSLEGRDIPLVTFSTAADDKSLPATFFMGGHHAREHVSIETALNLTLYLAREYKAGNPRVVNLLNSRTVYIAPIINPDGAEYDIATGDYKLWRKNRRQNSGSSYGVDLNRNYGFGWGGGGSSGSTGSDIYRGPSAFSEPETQAVKAFFETHDNITINLSLHTFSKLILYPWGHKYENIENAQDFAVHKTMAETMARWNGYAPQQSSELYIASGDTSDWAYGQMKRISFTFELDPGMDENRWDPGSGFYPGQDMIMPVFNKNIEPFMYLIEYSDNPYRVLQPRSVAYGLSSPLVD